MMAGRLTFRAVVTIVTALAFTGLFGSQLFNTATPAVQLLLGLLVLGLVAAGLSHLLINRVIWPYLQCRPAKERIVWVVVSLLAGFFLIFTIPLTIFPKINTIRLSATGEHNPEALGYEIWVTQIGEGNSTDPSRITEVCQGGNWIGKDGALVFAQVEPSTTICNIRSDSFVVLVLVMHPWSGIVQVEYANQVQDIDLYSSNKATGDEEGSVGPRKILQFQVALSKTETAFYFLLLAADTIAIGVLLLAVTIYGVRRPVLRYAVSSAHGVPWYLYGLPTLVCWSIYLLIFWPGFVSSDTITQLSQVASGEFYDWHPAFHTLTLWLFTRVWFSPAPVVILQIVLLSGLIGWSLSFLESRGVWWWLNWGIALFLAVSPCMGLIILNPWKDVAYSIALVCLALLSLRVVSQPEKPVPWIALGIITALVALYRHNGSPVAFGTLAGLIVLARSRWKPLLAALVVSIFLWLGVRGPLYQLVGVKSNDYVVSSPQPFSANLAYLSSFHYNAGSNFTNEDLRLLHTILPNGKNFDLTVIPSQTEELFRLVLRLTYANPRVTWQFFQSRFAYIFQIFQPPIDRTGYVELRIYENPWGLELNSKLPAAQPLAMRVIQKSERPAWDWLFWRNAFWMYVMVLATVVACIRLKSPKMAILLIPVLLNALPLSLFAGGQISRYILPTLILAPLFSGYLFFIQPAQEPQVGVR